MQHSNLRIYWKRFFIWRPVGYVVFGILKGGHHFVLFSMKSNKIFSRPNLDLGGYRYIDIERDSLLQDLA